MTSERALWQSTRKHLAPFGRLLRIESNLTEQGIPDVAYCVQGHAGWLELKEHEAWPVRPGTALRVPHLSLEQVLFAEDWTAHGGSSYVLIQVARDYLLLPPPLIRAVYERAATRSELILGATAYGSGYFPTVEIVQALTGRAGAEEPPRAIPPPNRPKRRVNPWEETSK